MLFYNLGSFKQNPTLDERVQKLFQKDRNTFFVNASATGKTRLLYEGLFRHWGLYITAHADDLEAKALGRTLDDFFFGEEEMSSRLPKESALGYRKLLDANLKALHRRFSMVLLVHLLVFKEFLKAAHAEGVIDNEDLQHRWLQAQLSYPCLLGSRERDAHLQLLEMLYWDPATVIDTELNKVIGEINPLLPVSIQTEGLFVALDEANSAAKQIWSPYSATEKHPVIKSIIRTFRDQLALLDCAVTFVVAGTEISSEVFPLASPEWSAWRWTSDTGSFDDRELQRRHRLTAVIIEMLLGDSMAHPHGTLNKYIERLVSYTPSDAAAFIAEEGPCNVRPFFRGIGELINVATHEVVFHYAITGEHPPHYDISRLELVSSAVGEFKDQEMQVIVLDQPGPTIAAAIWFNTKNDDSTFQSLMSFDAFCAFYNRPWPNGDNYSSTGFIAFYLAHAFVNGRLLSEVFAIPAPKWIKDPTSLARLVILRKDKHGTVDEIIVGPSALLPAAPPLGYTATTPDDVIAWLELSRTGAFCICPPDCGAELIFILKLHGKYIWVVLRTAGRGKELQTEDVYPEFEALTEQRLFSCVHGRQFVRNTSHSSLRGASKSPRTSGSPSLLRALASFPVEPPLSRPMAQTAQGCPVAVLKIETFKHLTETLSPEDLVEGLISSMHSKRSLCLEDQFSSISPPSKSDSRRGKRKRPD
ncbi:hypothetical protein DXG01_001617 [Tephrocybe rancida]|nr:hypothetical protein DXG01_001617 [Tephrocybe rancida]